MPFQHILPTHQACCALAIEDITEADLAERLAVAAATPFQLAQEIPIRAGYSASGQNVTYCSCSSTISRATAGRWARSGVTSLGPIPLDIVAIPRPGWNCPYSTLTIHCGSVDYWAKMRPPTARWRASSRSGGRRSRAFPRNSVSPSTDPDPNCHAPRSDRARAPQRRVAPTTSGPCSRHRGEPVHGPPGGLRRSPGTSGRGDDIPIGTAVAGRGERALEELVGFFVNTLVIRTDVSGDPSFRELVSRVRAFALDAYAHQDAPFERVVEALQPARSLPRHPLFQVMLVLQNTPESDVALPGLTVHEEPLVGVVSKFDLTLGLSESLGPGKEPDGIEGVIEYSRDLFDQATVELIGTRFVRLLEQAATSPDERLHRLCVLEPVERHELLEGFNATACPVPESTLPELFEAQVARDPDAVAVVSGAVSLSYRELNTRANRLAHHLISLGVEPESVVAVYMERSPEMLVALLSILKAGAAYLPLDPENPTSRLGRMLADASPACVLTTAALKNRLPEKTDVVTLNEPASPILFDQAPSHDPTDRDRAGPIRPGDMAYVIYTSGSSGAPKGVVIPAAGC